MGDQGNFGVGQENPLRPAMLIVGPGRGADVLLAESMIRKDVIRLIAPGTTVVQSNGTEPKKVKSDPDSGEHSSHRRSPLDPERWAQHDRTRVPH